MELEKVRYRTCLIISNTYINHYTGIIWVMTITSRKQRYFSDIVMKTRLALLMGD